MNAFYHEDASPRDDMWTAHRFLCSHSQLSLQWVRRMKLFLIRHAETVHNVGQVWWELTSDHRALQTLTADEQGR